MISDTPGVTERGAMLGAARSALAFDVVRFEATCPSCGQIAVWIQERTDTAVRTTILCPDDDRCRAIENPQPARVIGFQRGFPPAPRPTTTSDRLVPPEVPGIPMPRY